MFKLFQNTLGLSNKSAKPTPYLLRGEVASYSFKPKQNENNKETTNIDENVLEVASTLKP